MNNYIRLNITTEGQTEFGFVKNVLSNHLQPFDIFCKVRSVLIPEYQKSSSGSLLTDLISIVVLREKCKHFNEWLTKLELLNYNQQYISF